MQTVQRYIEALAIGQKAFEEPVTAAKPLPHIFGSAAYIQDQHAGLGCLQLKPENPANQQLATEIASRTVNSARLPPATFNHPALRATEPADTDYKPQNLKAMLEAALKGNVPSQSVYETAPCRQQQHESPAASSQAASKAWQDTQQSGGADAASADLPHVLAWLEQGRGLFDDDE